MTMKKIVIAPHPDDEILGCGGYLLKSKSNNDLIPVDDNNVKKNKANQNNESQNNESIYYVS